MPYVKVGDINMYYEVYGEGFPLVMIMGLEANKDWWPLPLIEELSKKNKVVVFDNRGAGRSDKPDIPYSIKMFADDTVNLMNVLGVDRAHIFGVSMGGFIAQEIAINYPERVEKLILGCTTCGGDRQILPSADILNTLTMKRSRDPRETARKYVVPLLFTEDTITNKPNIINTFIDSYVIAPIPESAFGRQLEAILGHDTCSRLHEIKAQTLILHGDKDILVPPENAKILAELIPNSNLVIIENTGHAFIGEEVDKIIGIIQEFLER